MKAALVALLAAVATQPWPPSLAAVTSNLFLRVRVSKARLIASRTTELGQLPSGLSSPVRCSAACTVDPQCQIWCHEASSKECLVSDIIVTSAYVETDVTDALTCYTRRHKDFAAGASIEGSPSSPSYPLRVKENLVDGIFDQGHNGNCYRTESSLYRPFFVLDFGAAVEIRLVKLFAQTYGHKSLPATITDMKVRVGMAAAKTPGDFSSYQLFGSFPGPAVTGQVVVLESPVPVTARFLSVQKMQDTTRLQICHIEVY